MTDKMTIINAQWTPTVNILRIKCRCGHMFGWRADRRKVQCPKCGRQDDLLAIKNRSPKIEEDRS